MVAGNSENGNSKKKNGNKMTKHHLVPRSRGGGEIEKNIIKIPDRYHAALHILIGNLNPEEALIFFEKVFLGKGRKRSWKADEIYQLQLKLQAETLKKEKEKEKEKKRKK